MSTTTWQRIEPCPPADSDAVLSRALEARVHDALFLLCRQWQLGEFEGEDAASPAAVNVHGDVAGLSRYCPSGGAASDYDPATSPLQRVVEQGGAVGGSLPTARLRAAAGLRLLRRLQRAAPSLCHAYRTAPFVLHAADPGDATVDERSRRFIAALADRVPDGAAVHERLAKAPTELPGWDTPAARKALQAWGKWYESEIVGPSAEAAPAWDGARFEYAFDVGAAFAAGDELILHAEECTGDADWPDFGVRSGSMHARASAAPVDAAPVLPMPVTYPGMPAPRWWEIEQGRVDFGAVTVESEDLSRLLLLEFALSYGNDWFLLPLDLEVGTLCRLRQLQVRDSFGLTTSVTTPFAADAPGWSMFSLAGDTSRRLLLLPATLGGPSHALEIERVDLARDQGANAAWAIERVLEGQDGRPLDVPRDLPGQAASGASDGTQTGTIGASSDAGAGSESAATVPPLQYRLSTAVPAGWLPLLPVRRSDGGVRLRLGRLFNAPAGTPRASVLAGTTDIFEEEVPRTGATLGRRWRYARWSDGSTHVWVGRWKRAGRGGVGSGLRFDSLDPAAAPHKP